MAIWIGIDPGENTGLAVWDGSLLRFREVSTLPLWRAMEEVRRWHYSCTVQQVPLLVVFEDARKRTWFPAERSSAEYRGRLMGAGAAKRDARIWEEFLDAAHIPFEARKPQAGLTKWSADYWSHVTGWKGRTSEHARDAGLLVFGRK
ncbi:MAG: hypothetical protein J6T17_02145 [Clostridia bacterium]|nr:hypothetical protein [Clostridia bacterium]